MGWQLATALPELGDGGLASNEGTGHRDCCNLLGFSKEKREYNPYIIPINTVYCIFPHSLFTPSKVREYHRDPPFDSKLTTTKSISVVAV